MSKVTLREFTEFVGSHQADEVIEHDYWPEDEHGDMYPSSEHCALGLYWKFIGGESSKFNKLMNDAFNSSDIPQDILYSLFMIHIAKQEYPTYGKLHEALIANMAESV